MSDPLPFGVGATLSPAMLSPCVGGLVRTWTSEGANLWRVDGDRLALAMGQGWIARTLRERDRYREVGLLHEESGTLLLQPRFPDRVSESGWAFEETLVRLLPAGDPTPTVAQDFRDLLGRAVDFTAASDGFLVLERGGWDAPIEPYCLFTVLGEPGAEMSLIETAPPPVGARHWTRHIGPGTTGATVRAPATAEAIEVAPILILDACSSWGLSPWDLALTYGRRPAGKPQ